MAEILFVKSNYYGITDLMPVSIIYTFEIIYVDKQQ